MRFVWCVALSMAVTGCLEPTFPAASSEDGLAADDGDVGKELETDNLEDTSTLDDASFQPNDTDTAKDDDNLKDSADPTDSSTQFVTDTSVPTTPTVLCSDQCSWADDDFCDDGGAGSVTAVCSFGSDCADCGPRWADDAPSDTAIVSDPWGIDAETGTLVATDSDDTDTDTDTLRDTAAIDTSGSPIDSDSDPDSDSEPTLETDLQDSDIHDSDGNDSDPSDTSSMICLDTCLFFADDGYCDDGGPNAVSDFCSFGEDCSDCGSRSLSDMPVDTDVGDTGTPWTHDDTGTSWGHDDTGAPGPIKGRQLSGGEIIVSEAMLNPDCGHSAEYFELYNAHYATVDLDGLIVENGFSSGSYVLPSHYLKPGKRVIVAADPVDYEDCYGHTPEFSRSMRFQDGIQLLSDPFTTIDEVEFSAANSPAHPGEALELDQTALDATSNDDISNWCWAQKTIGTSQSKGTPGTAASCSAP
jgi:hypothetical protein